VANRNGTPGFIGQDSPVKPNKGVKIPGTNVTGSKAGKAKGGKGTRGKSFKNAQGTKSGVMRNPS
jgi:hypothetical protein